LAEKSTFFNSVTGDRKYKAEDIAAHFAKLITNGVYPSGTQLQATEDAGMDVTVSAGSAWINGYAYHNENDFTLTFDAADGVLNRIDRIVVRWGRVARSINLAIIKGTPASSPLAPAIVRDADYYDLSIATVAIGAGITAISQAMITDTRGDSNVCGFVSSLIEPDTSGWFAQFENAFITWFETVQDILDEEVSGNLLNMINNLAGAGRTTETVKGNADALILHTEEVATTSEKGHVRLGNTADEAAPGNHHHDDDYEAKDANIMRNNVAQTMSAPINMADNQLTRPDIKDYAETVGTTPATTGTVTFNLTTGNVFNLTPTGAVTIGFSNWPANGKGGSVTVRLKNGATVYSKAFVAAIKWPNDEIPDLSEANKAYDLVFSTTNAGTVIHGAAVGPYSA